MFPSSFVFRLVHYVSNVVDVNECDEGTDDCQDGALCVNTVGSFVCDCPAGFRLVGNTCEGMNILLYSTIHNDKYCPDLMKYM